MKSLTFVGPVPSLATLCLLAAMVPAVASLGGLRAQSVLLEVSNLANSGPGSFRWALDEANRLAALAGPDRRLVISFRPELAGQTLTGQGSYPMLFAPYVTIQVAGVQPQAVVLDLPESFVASGRDLWLRDLRFQRPAARVGSGDNVILVGCRNARIERCSFENAPIAGLWLIGSPDAQLIESTFRNDVPGRLGQGLLVQDGADHLVIDGCVFEDLAGRGLALATVRSATIRNSTFRRVAGAMLLMESSRDLDIGPGNLIEDCTWTGITADLVSPINPGNPAEWGVRIHGNTIRNGSTSGIVVRNRSTRVLLDDNKLFDNGRDGQAQVRLVGVEGADVRNNQILRGLGVGLHISGGRDIEVHSGNRIEDNRGDGVVANGGGTDIWIGPRQAGGSRRGNLIRGNVGSAVVFSGIQRGSVTGGATGSADRTKLECGTGAAGASAAVYVRDGSRDIVIGPGVDCVGGAPAAVELVGVAGVRVEGITATGYTERALGIWSCADIRVSGCYLDGDSAALAGVSAFDSTPIELFDNEVRKHRSIGLSFRDCRSVLVGPGNRATRNGQWGFFFQRNSAPTAWASVQSSTAVNHVGAGTGAGFAFLGVSGEVVNATSAGNDQGIEVAQGAVVSAANSIFWQNRTHDRKCVNGTAFMSQCTYRTSVGTWGSGFGNSLADPQLVDLANDDVHLLPDSPAIDAGDVLLVNVPAADARITQRVLGRGIDRGSEEGEPLMGTPLTLLGSVMRPRSQNVFTFELDAGEEYGGHTRCLLAGFSGTTVGIPLLDRAVLPLRPDLLTSFWSNSPFAYGALDGRGREIATVVVPASITPYLPPELTFAFTVFPTLDWASNPVTVRWL